MEALISWILNTLSGLNPIVKVAPWEVGIWTTCGTWVRVLKPGMHLKIPFFTEVMIEATTETCPDLRCVTAITEDGESIAISPAIRYVLRDIETAYRKANGAERCLETVALGTIHKYVTTHSIHNGEDIESVRNETEKAVRRAAKNWGIEIIEVYLTDSSKNFTRLVWGAAPLTIINE